MTHEHCKNCPIATGQYCRAEHVPRYCELIDPDHVAYKATYANVIKSSSAEWVARMAGKHGSEYPALAVQVLGLFRSIKKFVASGGKLASKAVRLARLAICDKCPHYDRAKKRCRKCGCKEPIKVWAAAETCPDLPARWGPVEEKKAP